MAEVSTSCTYCLLQYLTSFSIIAGQSGLIGALASDFIDWTVLGTTIGEFRIDWVVGDTTESINYLESGEADIAITYNAAAEKRAMELGIATRSEYAFRDHFYLLGPKFVATSLSEE